MAVEAPSPAGEAQDESAGDARAEVAQHSGRLLVRMPATLHDELARVAKREGVSLNQLITGILAAGVEWRTGGDPASHARDRAAGDVASRTVRVALLANLAAVLLAAIVALTLLVAWRAGW